MQPTGEVKFKMAMGSNVGVQSGDLALIAQDLKLQQPGGFDAVLLMETLRPGVQILTSNGTKAVLIGLLLPAVQKIRCAAARSCAQVAPSLKADGSVGWVMGDGSVRAIGDVRGGTLVPPVNPARVGRITAVVVDPVSGSASLRF